MANVRQFAVGFLFASLVFLIAGGAYLAGSGYSFRKESPRSEPDKSKINTESSKPKSALPTVQKKEDKPVSPNTAQDESGELQQAAPTTTPSVGQENDGSSGSLSRQEIINQLVDILVQEDYDSLKPLLASSVLYRLEGSGCCGNVTPEEAVTNMQYISDANPPWIIDSDNEILKKVAEVDANYYGGDNIVALSDNDFVVSFSLDVNNKINQISVLNDYHMFGL